MDRLNQLKKGNDWFCPLYLKDEEAYDFDHYLAGVIGQYEAENYITTRIDNDDAMSIKTVERLQTYCREHQDNRYTGFHSGMAISIQSMAVYCYKIFSGIILSAWYIQVLIRPSFHFHIIMYRKR